MKTNRNGKIRFNYRKLRGKIKEVFDTQQAFASALGISQTSLSKRLNNEWEWSQQEMGRALELLGVDQSEINAYFFTPKV
jgi:transcriptional regulator with XRE-family HTH domain